MSEALNISDHLGYSDVQDFILKDTRTVDTPDGVRVSLKTKMVNDKPQCVFLSEHNQCTIHDVKPTQCRTYPFWPQTLMGKSEWEAEKFKCEGIENPAYPRKLSYHQVLKDLIVHQIHGRGHGSNLLYDEAHEVLNESFDLKVGADETEVLNSYSDEFFSTHSSTVLFEDENVRVVESSMPEPTMTLEAYIKEHGDDIYDDDNVIVPTEQARYRRLEFVNSPGISQSVVRMQPGDSLDVEYADLQMAVHRFMASFILNVIFHRHNNLKQEGCEDIRVLIVGAGGCALPMHVLKSSSVSKIKQGLLIEVVEPNERILDLAARYFGAEFKESDNNSNTNNDNDNDNDNKYVEKSGLISHRTTGESFLKLPDMGSKYDIIVVDAANDQMEDGLMVHRAPAASLLEEPSLLISRLSDQDGILVMNVMGSKKWAQDVNSKMKEVCDKEHFEGPVLLRIGGGENHALVVRRRGDATNTQTRGLAKVLNEVITTKDY